MAKTITVNVEENVEREFRKKAESKYGKKKGYLGKALTEAMKVWSKKTDEDIESRFIKLLESGIRMEKWKFNRAELHER